MVIAAVGTVLAAAYLLWLYQRTAFGEPKPEFVAHAHTPTRSAPRPTRRRHHDDDEHSTSTTSAIYEWIAWTPLLIGIIVLGIYPQLLFKMHRPGRHQPRSKAFGK